MVESGRVVTQVTAGDRALMERKTVTATLDEMDPGEIKDALVTAGYEHFLTLPMVTGGQVAGVVSALRLSGRTPFGRDEVRRAEILAPVVGAATNVARLVGEIQEANKGKTRFLANMSHELRTPLNAITGFSQVLAAGDFGPLNDCQERYVAPIETSVPRLFELIDDFLDLAKV